MGGLSPVGRQPVQVRVGARGGRDRRHVGQAGREQRVVRAEQRLVHRGPVKDDRQAQRAELQDLRRQLQARVQVGVAPAQPDVAGRGEPHRLLPGVPAVPGHAVALERVAHPLLVAGRVVVDLVACHVQLGGDAARRQQRGQLGHLQGVPARRELARVDQPERSARRRRAA